MTVVEAAHDRADGNGAARELHVIGALPTALAFHFTEDRLTVADADDVRDAVRRMLWQLVEGAPLFKKGPPGSAAAVRLSPRLNPREAASWKR